MDLGAVLSSGLLAATGPTAIAYAIAAVGLNLHFGYTGLLNFGHVAFLMVGAYGVAITVDAGGPLWLGIIMSIVAATVLALLMGLPTLRLRAEYLAIVTIAMAEVLRLLIRSSWAQGLTGGVFGIQGFGGEFHALSPLDSRTTYNLILFSVPGSRLWVMIVGWTLTLLIGLLTWRLINSPWGRLIRAIREDEDAARSIGKHVFARKLQVLVLGGVMGAIGGMLPALARQNVGPDLNFTAEVTFILYAIVILGGAGTVWGPILGAVVFQFLFFSLDTLMQQLQANVGWVNSLISSTGAAQMRVVFLGIGIMLLLTFRPQGLLGNREEALFGD